MLPITSSVHAADKEYFLMALHTGKSLVENYWFHSKDNLEIYPLIGLLILLSPPIQEVLLGGSHLRGNKSLYTKISL